MNTTEVSTVFPETTHDNGLFHVVIIALAVISIFDCLLQASVVGYVFITLIVRKCTVCRVFITSVFMSLRFIIGYTMITSFPLDAEWIDELAEVIPSEFILGWFYFGMSAVIISFMISFISCGLLLVRGHLRGQRLLSRITCEDGRKTPQVVILMPVYNEEPAALLRAVRSAVLCDYPQHRKHLIVAFDDNSQSPLFRTLVDSLTKNDNNNSIIMDPIDLKNATKTYPEQFDCDVEGMPVTVCRFPHGGKRATQAKSFTLINQLYSQQADNTYVLFIDSDIILQKNAIYNFITSAQSRPDVLGMTGLVTCTTSRKFNVLQCLQDAEYVEGQMMVRAAEVRLGAATCLPGALTLIHLKALQQVAPIYFGQLETEETTDFHRFHLGEDRYLTFLLMKMAFSMGQVGFECIAQCKTDAPAGFRQLLKQRRRWFLGGIVNDMAMISSPKIWSQFPLLNAFKFYEYSTRGLSFLTWVIIFAYNRTFSREKSNNSTAHAIFFYIPVVIIAMKLILTFVTAFQLNRRKVAIFTVLVFLLSPIFNGIVIMYSIWTWNVRSWGGPRTDNERKDSVQVEKPSPFPSSESPSVHIISVQTVNGDSQSLSSPSSA